MTRIFSWEELWDRLYQLFVAIASDLRECDPTLFFEADHFETEAFPFRTYANYSGSADREEMVLSFDCWQESNILQITADVAREGRQILAKWGPVEISWRGPDKGDLTGIFRQVDAVEDFFNSCRSILRTELCPDDTR